MPLGYLGEGRCGGRLLVLLVVSGEPAWGWSDWSRKGLLEMPGGRGGKLLVFRNLLKISSRLTADMVLQFGQELEGLSRRFGQCLIS